MSNILNTRDSCFQDSQGRVLNLRGVNLSGASKLPYYPKLSSHELNGFYESETTVSFVNRPFPLEEADEHFGRIRHWGFNFVRLNITWEALEHAGPGKYDTDYIQYLIKLLSKMKEYSLKCYIDPHQDVWSRWSGGSGAPAWTLRLVGFQLEHLNETGAAMLHNQYSDPSRFPKMIWPTNYNKLASATMFTLFFGGRKFAPKCVIDGINIQDHLQSHYINAIKTLVHEISLVHGLLDDVVVGYDTLNEPHPGFIGVEDIKRLPKELELKHGFMPTPLQAMILGEGTKSAVDWWEFGFTGPKCMGKRVLDPKGKRAWMSADEAIMHQVIPLNNSCVWANHGVWDKNSGDCLIPDYFSIDKTTGNKINFMQDFWLPFIVNFTIEMRKVHPECVIFVEPPVNEHPPLNCLNNKHLQRRICYSPHWYDGLTLINKSFNRWFNIDYLGVKRGEYYSYATAVKFGYKNIVECFKNQFHRIKEEGKKYLGSFPTIIGEIGIPFDMDAKESYVNGNFSKQIEAMDANMQALESTLMNFTLWTYCPENSHEWGDGWNGEDLSLYSRKTSSLQILDESKLSKDSQATAFETDKESNSIEQSVDQQNSAKSLFFDFNLNGRCLEAFCRPYPIATAGTPLSLTFNKQTKIMKYSYVISSYNPEQNQTTEIYMPKLHYESADCVNVKISDDLAVSRVDWESQRVHIDYRGKSPSTSQDMSLKNLSPTISSTTKPIVIIVTISNSNIRSPESATSSNGSLEDNVATCSKCTIM